MLLLNRDLQRDSGCAILLFGGNRSTAFLPLQTDGIGIRPKRKAAAKGRRIQGYVFGLPTLAKPIITKSGCLCHRSGSWDNSFLPLLVWRQ